MAAKEGGHQGTPVAVMPDLVQKAELTTVTGIKEKEIPEKEKRDTTSSIGTFK